MLRFGLSGVLRFYVVPSKESIPVFLTYTAMTLGMTGVLAHRRHPRGALVMVGAVGIVLALGPYLLLPGIRPIPLPYRLLAAVVPGFSALRVPQRFGVLAALALGSLSGLGLAAARRWLGTRGRVAAAAAGLPRPDALDAVLRQVPLRWVLLHRDALAAGTSPAWEATLRQALTPVADFGETILFEVPADRRPGGVS